MSIVPTAVAIRKNAGGFLRGGLAGETGGGLELPGMGELQGQTPKESLPVETPGWALETPPGDARDLPRWVYLVGLAVVTVAGAVVRAVWLDHPMRYDESWTFLFYVLPRKLGECLTYSAPNNHVLHTLLVAGASWVGGNSPWVLRMPAFLAGVALIPAAGRLARVVSGRRLAGLMAAAFVAGSSMLVEYSVNARGYTLFCLTAVGLAECTVRIMRNARAWGPWIGWMAIAAVGLANIPVMVYPMVVLAIVLVGQAWLSRAGAVVRWGVVWRMVGAMVAAGVLGLALYIPVFYATGLVVTAEHPDAQQSGVLVCSAGLYAIVANPILASRPMGEVLAELGGVPIEALREWTRDTCWAWAVLAGGGLVAAAVVGVRERRAFYLLPVALVVLPVLAIVQRVVPFARLWLFALPLCLVVASCGLAALVGWARAGWPRGVAMGAVLAAVVAVSADSAWRMCRPGRRVLGECSLVDARAIVADALELADGRTGLAWDFELPTWPPLAYYELLLSSESRQFVHYMDEPCRRVVVVVPKVETLQEVLEHRPHLAARYGPMLPWRSYESADVYVGLRREKSEWP